jgi:hypothetical protein
VIVTDTLGRNGAPSALHLLTTNGGLIATVHLPPTSSPGGPYQQYIWSTGPRLIGDHVYFVDGSQIRAVGPDGRVAVVGTLSTPNIDPQWAFEVGLAISPDERQIAYGYPVRTNGTRPFASRMFVESVGGTPHELIEVSDETIGFLLPFAWTPQGIWMLHAGTGDGAGYLDNALPPARAGLDSMPLPPLPSRQARAGRPNCG